MKKLILTALVLISTAAFAVTYENANAKQQMCKAAGTMAAMAYSDKQAGTPRENIIGMIENNTKVGDQTRTAMTFVVNTVYSGNFYEKQEAYMFIWSKCMDGNLK